MQSFHNSCYIQSNIISEKHHSVEYLLRLYTEHTINKNVDMKLSAHNVFLE